MTDREKRAQSKARHVNEKPNASGYMFCTRCKLLTGYQTYRNVTICEVCLSTWQKTIQERIDGQFLMFEPKPVDKGKEPM